ncbi:hypothetical protein [Sorangium sp. So ce388]|uniref:Uncharacterized protein n=1 Tax=Sorangium cellulosum TaxID=56 RepID=A0A150RFJ9_SORCE|nr:hypothetical protein BE17_20045 [Sorangium cellulosum]
MANHLKNELIAASNSPDPALSAWARQRLGPLSSAPDAYFWRPVQQARARNELQRLQNDLAREQGAADARARAIADRRARFDRNNSDTWDMNPVQYLNGVTEGDVLMSPEGDRILRDLANGHLNDRHHAATEGRMSHQHLSGGSRGIGFIYVQQPDGTVTPYVVDLGDKQPDNTYRWDHGGIGYVPPRPDGL